MIQTKSLALTATAGEEVGQELGAQMISSYRAENPTDTLGYYIGRNILEQILAQPGCVGIKFYNAYHEDGEKALVYVGVDAQGNDMLQITSINTQGILENTKGIVADRSIRVPTDPETPSVSEEGNWWEF